MTLTEVCPAGSRSEAEASSVTAGFPPGANCPSLRRSKLLNVGGTRLGFRELPSSSTLDSAGSMPSKCR